ncbi:AAA family ATPase [Rhodospira trueperi]|uniref:AAA family ATPase n=1 Tax=Rhodospira trueperi TaxID=69960 RepID=UPI001C40B4E8|nr:AAA family ATPase [Rhodospira trueperi]
MPDIADRKISLPTIKRVALANFDLYSNNPNVSTVIERPVFFLIGANGLGKSTFLNTINFTITGAIPDPSRKFQSAQDYLRNAGRADRSEDYFSGRISEHSRSIASATVELAWSNANLSVTRDLFGGTGVSRLAIEDVVSGTIDVRPSSEEDSNDLTGLYHAKILELTGLEDFAQFVFLMHFVATFDEGRHLLMWDDAALTNALYLAFGADPVAAKAADKLQREMDRESSRARNVRFSARHVSDRIKQLADLLEGTETDDHTTGAELQAQHDALVARQSDAEQRMRRKQAEMLDADLKWTDLSASLTEAQLEYRRLFSNRLQLSSSVEHHPIVRATLSEDRCGLCGNVHVAAKIQAALDKGECPLCDSVLDRSGGDAAAISELQRLDSEIARIRDDLDTILRSRARISDEFAAAQATEEAAAEELRQFEEKEAAGLVKAQSGSNFSAIQLEIDKLEKERQAFLAQSEAHYRKRDELRNQLRSYEKALKEQYEAGSERFVPRFRELSEDFIGRPIDVDLEHRQGANDSGFGLRMRMDDQLRAQSDSVSESQRFFIDIALRMALSEYMAKGAATLLIDTPEGSLDIAYEARAGSMFSKFVAEGNRVLMTANLRSSQLVLRLAGLQKSDGMQVVRMTDWTDLSEVQRSEEALFIDAYNAIDGALN